MMNVVAGCELLVARCTESWKNKQMAEGKADRLVGG